MIQNGINWLHNHKWINLMLVVLYVVFVVFAHDAFVQLSIVAMESLSLPVYNAVVAIIALVLLLSLVFVVVRAYSSKMTINKSGIPFLAVVLVGLIVHFFVFTEMNIEFIHAAEFGLLGFLLYPLLGRFGAVGIVALPILCLDEWYQYQVLYPGYVEYFDFNDLQLDLLGIGLVLSLIKTFDVSLNNSRAILIRPETFTLLLYILVASGLIRFGILATYPESATENTWLVLNQISEPYGFWRLHPDNLTTYHVLEPIMGSVVVFSWCAFYLLMDSIKPDK